VNEETRRRVVAAAEERTLAYPARVEEPLAFGTRQYRSRIRGVLAVFVLASVLIVGGLLAVHPAVGEAFGPQVAGVSVSPSTLSLRPGEEAALTATLSYSDGRTERRLSGVEWSSGEPGVAIVTSAGVVLARTNGSATITATVDGRSSTATVTVLPVALTRILLAPPSVAMLVGDAVTLSARGEYADGTSRPLGETLAWSTGNIDVAAVDSAGRLAALAAGETVVTATDGALSASATVTVTAPVRATGIRIDPGELTLDVGDTARLTAVTVFSDDSSALLAKASWRSSDEKVARVDGSGLLTALSPGTTVTITATANGFSDTATVTVTAPVTLTSITVRPATTDLLPGGTVQLTATGHYSDGTAVQLDSADWSSSDEDVVAVDGSGLATAQGFGSGTTITAAVGDMSGTATVNVPSVVE
jgi:uncharacterized protein YjdB